MLITYNIVFKNVKRDVRDDDEEEEEGRGGVHELHAANGRVTEPAAVSTGVQAVKQ